MQGVIAQAVPNRTLNLNTIGRAVAGIYVETRHARAHVQKYPNHDMWKARSQAVPNQ